MIVSGLNLLDMILHGNEDFTPDQAPDMHNAPGASLGAGTGRSGDCRNGFGGGWSRYSPVDANNGSRATGIEACLDSDFINNNPGSGTRVSGDNAIKPPAYDWAATYAWELGNSPAWKWRNACHLLGKQLGGDGLAYENLATCSRTANASRMDAFTPEHRVNNMAHYEGRVKEAVDKGNQVVHYKVTPMYEGSRVVPVAFRMQASGYDPSGGPGIFFDAEVPNEMYSKSDGQWHNMGQWAPRQWVR